jgi:N-methylhydantoinase B/oxoprolinase/acetone carboxylase alpha subunit
LPSKINLRVEAGEGIRLETPGGGGWGKSRRKK